jgi:hypothetical protein
MPADVSEKHIQSFFRVEKGKSLKQAARKSCHLLLMRHVPPKRQLTMNGLHGVMSQKTVLSGLFTVAVNPPNAAKFSVLILF